MSSAKEELKKSSPSKSSKPSSSKPTIQWDDSSMNSSYANVVNAFSTREEFTLLFGTNQTWNTRPNGEVKIKLSDRIILNPLAAKRLYALIGGLLKEYEERFGPLELVSEPPKIN